MTALIVIAAILLFFAILLFSPIVLRIYYTGGELQEACVRYFFVKIDFSPKALAKRAEKKAKHAVKDEFKKQKKHEPAEAEPKKEKRALEDTIKTVWSMVKACKQGLDTLRNHIIFYKVKSTVLVGGDDAHKIALNYPRYCVLASSIIDVIALLFVLKTPKIHIEPSFLLEKTQVDISFRMRIAPWFVLVAAVQIGVNIIKVLNKNKRKRKKVKGGKRHEPATSSK